MYCNSLHCFTLFFTLSPDFGKRIFGKRFLKTDYFENVYGKRIRVLRKTVLLTIERDRFDDFKESNILSWNLHATSRFTIICKVKVIAKKECVKLLHCLYIFICYSLLFFPSPFSFFYIIRSLSVLRFPSSFLHLFI